MCVILVADGLGHGLEAQAASLEAVRMLHSNPNLAPGELLERVHQALRSTRGAAVSVARIDLERGTLTFAGVGNISAQIYSGAQASQHLVSVNGTAGHQVQRIREFSYPWPDDGMLVMHSDGLSTNAGLEKHSGPGAARSEPDRRRALPGFYAAQRRCHRGRGQGALRQESMSLPILSFTIRFEHDTVAARQRARQIARLLGFDHQDQTRISTAVSEIARNAFNYAGGGRVEYLLEGRTAPQLFIIKITDSGPGHSRFEHHPGGTLPVADRHGPGNYRRAAADGSISNRFGARPRNHRLAEETASQARPRWCNATDIAQMASALIQERPQDAFQELQHQNQELLGALEEIRTRQADLTRLNRELEDTNRGVVALYAELDEKADHLRRADELKSRFLSNMSHEFRSPLNSILALSGLLLGRTDGDLTAEQAQQVGYVRRAAQDLLELVNDLLDLAKVEAGKVEVKPVEFEAANLFAALRGMLRPLLLNQSVDLIFEPVDHLPRMYSDEGKVSQILRNFISNSLKFTERGEIRVSASLAGDGEVRFSVSDTGIGIAPTDLDLIFQDFGQVDHPIQKRVRGTGLGLPLSKKLAALLGGRVLVESELGADLNLRCKSRFVIGKSARPPRRRWSGFRIPPACPCWWSKTVRK